MASAESNKIKESILEQFRTWCIETKKQCGNFPNLPSEEEWQQPEFNIQKFFSDFSGPKPEDAEGTFSMSTHIFTDSSENRRTTRDR